MDLHDPLEQVLALARGEVEVPDVVGGEAVVNGVVVAQLALGQVGSQQGVGDEGAGQLAALDVLLDLQADLVPGEVLLQLRRVRRVEAHLEPDLERLPKLLLQAPVVLHPDHRAVLFVEVAEAEVVLLEEVDRLGDILKEVVPGALAADVELEGGAVQEVDLHQHPGCATLQGRHEQPATKLLSLCFNMFHDNDMFGSRWFPAKDFLQHIPVQVKKLLIAFLYATQLNKLGYFADKKACFH